MKRKFLLNTTQYLLLLLLALVFKADQLSAQTVSIGTTGTLSSYFYGPIYRSSSTSVFHYSKYAYLYTATEIAAAGINNGDQISAISFYKNSTFQLSGTNSGTMKIYANNTTNTALTSGTTWGAFVGTATLVDSIVYNSTSNIPGSVGWITYNFSSPITYTGGALEIYVDWVLTPTTSPYSGGAFNWLYNTGYSTNVSLGFASSAAGSSSTALATGSYGGTLRPNTQLTYIPGTSCSGQPTAGTINGPTSVCPNILFNLTVSGSSIGSGLQYQWQSSPTGTAGSWTNITGATFSSYSASQSVATYYRRYIVCASSSLADTTASKLIGVNSVMACYCSPTTSGGSATYYISGFSTTNALTNINNTVSAGNATGYQNFTSLPSLVVVPGGNFNYSINVAGNSNYGMALWLDTNMDGTFQASEQFLSTTTYIYPPVTGNIAIPLSARTGTTRLRVLAAFTPSNPSDPCVNSGSGEYQDYSVNIYAPPACSGIPNAGNAYGPFGNMVCANSSFTLSDTGYSVASGLSFQWKSSPAGLNTWTNVAGATTANYTVTAGINAPMDYQLVITCSNGGGQTISNTVNMQLSPFYLCYCSPLNGVTLHTTALNYITNVSIVGTPLNNTTTTVGAGGYTQYWPTTTTTTANIVQGMQYTLNATAAYSSYPIAAWVDMNGNGTFDTTEWVIMTPNGAGTLYSGTFSIPTGVSSVSGNTGIRLRVGYTPGYTKSQACFNYSSGYETEDYVVNVTVPSGCTGTPTAGTAFGPTGVCANTSFTINDSAYTVAAGISFQWQSSPSGMNTWSPVTGATSPIYTIAAGINAAMDYRLVVTCANGGGQDISNTISVSLNPFYNCYCISQATSNADEDIFNVTLGSLNNTSTCTTLAPGPGSIVAQYSNYTTLTPTTLFLGATYPLSVQIGYCGTGAYSNIAAVYIDFNHNGVFTDPGDTVFTSNYAAGVVPNGRVVSGNITIPLTALSGVTGMRVVAVEGSSVSPCGTYTWGETEDYLVNIQTPSGCTGTPTAGTAFAPTSVCPSTSLTLSDTAYTVASGITFQWQQQIGSGGWTNISGATIPSYTISAGQTVTTQYRFSATCTTSSQTNYSNIVTVNVLPFSQCYCAAVNAGGTGCLINNFTFAGINNNTATTNPTASPFYTSYAQTAWINKGASAPMSVTIDPAGTYAGAIVSAWIDYNQDGIYDASEWTQIGTNITSGTTATVTIAIPLTATPGITGMRIRSRGTGNPNGATDACTNM
ncbi:MAG: hypothetical protein JST88_11505, partial [Bacteroidetes bacterium]|nr:hypothetical protein [Bacteroidota bacterium]